MCFKNCQISTTNFVHQIKMPRRGARTNSVTKTQNKAESASKSVTKKKTKNEEGENKETDYNRTYRTVRDKTPKRKGSGSGTEMPERDTKQAKKKRKEIEIVEPEAEIQMEVDEGTVAVTRFEDDDQVIDMVVTDEQTKEFPSASEEEDISDEEYEERVLNSENSKNNNAATARRVNDVTAAGLLGANRAEAEQLLPESFESGNVNTVRKGGDKNQEANRATQIKDTFELMQTFMLQKGLIDKLITENEMQEYLMTADNSANNKKATVNEDGNNNAKLKKPSSAAGKTKGKNPIKPSEKGNNPLNFPIQESHSEATVYKRAVQQFEPMLNQQIHNYIESVRSSLNQNVSSSSEEPMDTSDESGQALVIDANNLSDLREANTSRGDGNQQEETVSQEQYAEQIIKDSEKSKARLYEVPGKVLNFAQSAAQMDEDYQMIDTHVDDTTRRKIWCYEYVDFSKLIVRNRVVSDETEQRMEIVSRNGYTFLSPISERDAVQINSYGRWEQAFSLFKYSHI